MFEDEYYLRCQMEILEQGVRMFAEREKGKPAADGKANQNH